MASRRLLPYISYMKLTSHRYETKTVAELKILDEELVKKSVVLEHEVPVLQKRIDALKAAKRKLKRAKK
jgi:hypothetical protein